MDTFGKGDLSRLLKTRTGPCITLYQPTHPVGTEGQQDAIRLNNLLNQAERQLTDDWVSPGQARKLLSAARELSGESKFWKKRSRGLAVFVDTNTMYRYRLPLSLEEAVFINQRFHLKPLLPLLEGDDRFFILTISQNNVGMFRGSRFGIERMDVPGLPTKMAHALNYTEADRGTQFHSAGSGVTGKQSLVFHGHGGLPEAHKGDLIQYFRLIDSALSPILRGENSPLLLASVEYLVPLYRQVNHYPNILDGHLAGNCDHLNDRELHQRAWTLMEPVIRKSRERASERYREFSSTRQSSEDLTEVISAAREGRVDTLLVDSRRPVWGRFSDETGQVERHASCQAGDDDLLDVAALLTLTHRGTVYSCDEMPCREPIAAVFRYEGR